MDIMRSQVNMTWIKMPHHHTTHFLKKKPSSHEVTNYNFSLHAMKNKINKYHF